MLERLDTQRDAGRFFNRELAIHLSRYFPTLSFAKGLNILDLGCGEGYASKIFLDAGCKSYSGIDVSSVAIHKAEKLYADNSVNFQQISIEDAVSDGISKYDIICSVESLEHCDNPLRILRCIYNNCKDDAVIYVTFPNDSLYFGLKHSLNEHHKSLLSFDEFKTLISEAGFSNTHFGLGFSADGFLNVPEGNLSEQDKSSMERYLSKPIEKYEYCSIYNSGLSNSEASYFYAIFSKGAQVMDRTMSGVVFPVNCSLDRPGIGVESDRRLERNYKIVLVVDSISYIQEDAIPGIEVSQVVGSEDTSQALHQILKENPDHVHFCGFNVCNSVLNNLLSGEVNQGQLKRLMKVCISANFSEDSPPVLYGKARGFFNFSLRTEKPSFDLDLLRKICISGRRADNPSLIASRLLIIELISVLAPSADRQR